MAAQNDCTYLGKRQQHQDCGEDGADKYYPSTIMRKLLLLWAHLPTSWTHLLHAHLLLLRSVCLYTMIF